jgi:hypothetical protein
MENLKSQGFVELAVKVTNDGKKYYIVGVGLESESASNAFESENQAFELECYTNIEDAELAFKQRLEDLKESDNEE